MRSWISVQRVHVAKSREYLVLDSPYHSNTVLLLVYLQPTKPREIINHDEHIPRTRQRAYGPD